MFFYYFIHFQVMEKSRKEMNKNCSSIKQQKEREEKKPKQDCFVVKKSPFAVSWNEVTVNGTIDLDLLEQLEKQRSKEKAFWKEIEKFLKENDISKIGKNDN